MSHASISERQRKPSLDPAVPPLPPSFSAAFDLPTQERRPRHTVDAVAAKGFAGFQSLLFGLFTVGLPGGTGRPRNTKGKPARCNNDAFRSPADIELSLKARADLIATAGKSCIENERMHNSALTRRRVASSQKGSEKTASG